MWAQRTISCSTLALNGEYSGMICAAAVMWTVASITVATHFFVYFVLYMNTYRVSGSTLTAVGRSQLLARWPGTHWRALSGIQRAAQTVLGVYLKRTCSRNTSASSAL